MSYVGNTPTQQAFTPAVDYFNGNGSTVAFTLSRPVASVAQVEVTVNNVVQNPSSSYTISGNTITFSAAPSSGTNNVYVRYTSPITQVNALTQGPSVIGPMYVGINNATPLGGATNPILGTSGAANNYVQSYVLNQTNGASSSADFTAYPSNGTDASGWVDVGITSPSYSAAAYSVTGPNESYLFGSAPSGSSTTGNLVIATDSTGTQNAIQFYTNGFTKAKTAFAAIIDASGNFGIGMTPSAWGSYYPAIQANPASAFTFAAKANDVQIASNVYQNNSFQNLYATTGQAATKYIGSATSGTHTFLSSGTSGTAGNQITDFPQVLAFSKGTSVALQGATTQTGAGISFPATQSPSSDANTLDDYEEGTWTPTIAGLSGGSCTMTSGASGAYTKVGNLVTVTCAILSWSSKTTLVSNVIVSGLPFTPRTGLRFAGSIAGGPASSMSFTGQLFVGNDGGGAYFWLIGKDATNNTYFHLQDANILSSGTIYGLTMSFLV